MLALCLRIVARAPVGFAVPIEVRSLGQYSERWRFKGLRGELDASHFQPGMRSRLQSLPSVLESSASGRAARYGHGRVRRCATCWRGVSTGLYAGPHKLRVLADFETIVNELLGERLGARTLVLCIL